MQSGIEVLPKPPQPGTGAAAVDQRSQQGFSPARLYLSVVTFAETPNVRADMSASSNSGRG
jgi:hypothetical protein